MSGSREPSPAFETRSWTADASVNNSTGEKSSSRISRTNLSCVTEDDLPALPFDAWKKRSMKRSSYDFKHISVGLPNDEAAVLAHDARRHSTTMTPIASKATSPLLMDSPKLPPLAPSRSLKSEMRVKSHIQRIHEQHDLHADLHWEISAGNPRNWSTQRRRIHMFIPGAATFICMLGSTILTPAQALASEGEIASHVALLPTSLYLLGLAFGPMLGNLGSHILGRKYTYLISLSLYAMFLLAAGLSQHLAGLVVCRFLAGVSCSPVIHLGTGTILDMRAGCHRVSALAWYISTILAGSALGPLIGGHIATKAGISWTQYAILLAVAVLLVATICMQETEKKSIDRRKDGVSRLAAISKEDCTNACLAPLSILETDLILWATTLYAAYLMGVLYAVYTALPAVFAEVLGFSIGEQGTVFLSMAVGSAVGSMFLFTFQRWHYVPRVERFKEEKATEDERTLFTGRKASKSLNTKRSRDSLRSSTHTQGGRRSSFVQSLKRLSTPGARSGAQPQDDYQRNAIMAQAAAIYLNGVEKNADKRVTADQILCILDQRPEFGHFCTTLETLRLKYDRVDLAKALVEALNTNASTSKDTSLYIWYNNSSVNDIEQHRKAAAGALEAGTATLPQTPTMTTALSQCRKTFIPPVNAPPPEWRLWLTIPASLLIVGSLFMLGWTVSTRIHWMAPVIAMAIFGFGLVVALVSTVQYLLDCYDASHVSTVLAAHTTLGFLSAFVFSLFAKDVLQLGAGPGMSVYACFSIVFGTLPILLYSFGPKLRQRQSIRRQYNTRR